MAAYEHTTYTMPCAPHDMAPREPVRRRDIFPDGSAFVLENMLSREECAFFVAKSEAIGFKSSGYPSQIRVCARISVNAPALAAKLFERAEPFLSEPIVVARGGERPRGVPDDVLPGTWRPIGLNEVIRICRYTKGGFFLPHFDYGFERTMQERSLQTFMFYLNDDFDGAPTTFYDDTQEHYVRPDDAKALERVRVPAGGVLVFKSQVTHDGGLLRTGKKYIMRTEVMYAWERAADEGFTFGGRAAELCGDDDSSDGEEAGDDGSRSGDAGDGSQGSVEGGTCESADGDSTGVGDGAGDSAGEGGSDDAIVLELGPNAHAWMKR